MLREELRQPQRSGGWLPGGSPRGGGSVVCARRGEPHHPPAAMAGRYADTGRCTGTLRLRGAGGVNRPRQRARRRPVNVWPQHMSRDAGRSLYREASFGRNLHPASDRLRRNAERCRQRGHASGCCDRLLKAIQTGCPFLHGETVPQRGGNFKTPLKHGLWKIRVPLKFRLTRFKVPP